VARFHNPFAPEGRSKAHFMCAVLFVFAQRSNGVREEEKSNQFTWTAEFYSSRAFLNNFRLLTELNAMNEEKQGDSEHSHSLNPKLSPVTFSGESIRPSILLTLSRT